MIRVRPSGERGRFDHGWLDTAHTFSFADYRDPRWVRFRTLRVLNEDVVAPGRGFGMHPHADMEILTVVLSGALRHEDSMGNGSVIRPGEIQRMTAGTGVTHAERNASETEPVHLLQIWILPERRGLAPGYEQAAVNPEAERGRLAVLASPRPGRGAVSLHQDAEVLAARLAPGDAVAHPLGHGRGAWVQVAEGSVTLNGHALAAGDGAAVEGEEAVEIRATSPARVLLFDLG